jgi:hypothetical protein
MSELKVNKITPKTGTSIQLGESGDTITIPCGATLTNNGTATGFGLSFCTTVKTSPFTATANKGFLINTGSAVTVTLPASPSTGDELIVVDQTGQAATNNITLGRNGSKIKGGCIDATIETNRAGLRLVYSGSSQGWITATAGNDAIATTDKYIVASGGNTVTTCGNFKIHTFTGDGTFTVTCAGNSAGSNTVSYVVVAGGGGAGGDGGGGGGAGGYREGLGLNDSFTGSPLRSPTGVPVSTSPGSYPITVGGGGSGAPQPQAGADGTQSVFSTITSAGGGRGGGNGGAQDGGSGGGGQRGSPQGAGAGNTPPVSPPQGTDGGSGGPPNGGDGGGGGGGATVAGSTNPGNAGGAGGTGATSSITRSPVARAGGGGGGATPGPNTKGAGGSGGGGAGAGCGANAVAGTTNTGGGGGGSSGSTGPQTTGASGGSGIVIISYKYQ